MKNQKIYTTCQVSYRGSELPGLCASINYQRTQQLPYVPDGFKTLCKQRFNDGLRIVLIAESVNTNFHGYRCRSCGRLHQNKNGWVSSRICGVCQIEADEKLKLITIECVKKDSSDKHKDWLIHVTIHNSGYYSKQDKAIEIINDNWKK